ncbi:MAG: hypothetical protein DRI93_00155 [Aquificota bacterium]|nr:MAG: hypothetical protein DRI93_00155 [Aquificota bacterium]RLD97437.1 MAG: hypothetical protein DRI91_05185 [Aquificota bacterium]
MDLRDVTVRLWVPRSQVALLVAMVESYESLGVVRIVDAKKALAEIYASPSFLDLLLDLLQDLSREGISVNVLEISR